MKVHVDFTLDIPAERLPELRKFMSCDTKEDLIYALKGEAEESLMSYLEDNGFRDVKVSRRDGQTVSEDSDG